MKIGVIFYYVGDLQVAINAYSVILDTAPSDIDRDWARFKLEGSDLAVHLNPTCRASKPLILSNMVPSPPCPWKPFTTFLP